MRGAVSPAIVGRASVAGVDARGRPFSLAIHWGRPRYFVQTVVAGACNLQTGFFANSARRAGIWSRLMSARIFPPWARRGGKKKVGEETNASKSRGHCYRHFRGHVEDDPSIWRQPKESSAIPLRVSIRSRPRGAHYGNEVGLGIVAQRLRLGKGIRSLT